MTTVTFKWEDEIDGEPIGPLTLCTSEGERSDLGWKTRTEALEVAREHGVTLTESGGDVDVRADWLSLGESLGLTLLTRNADPAMYARDCERWTARYVQETGRSSEAEALSKLFSRIDQSDEGAPEALALLFEAAGRADLVDIARLGGTLAVSGG